MKQKIVDLRAAARALLAGQRQSPLAMHPDALGRIVAIARSDAPVHADFELEHEAAGEQAARPGAGGLVMRGSTAVIPLKGMITPQGSYLQMLFGGGAGGLRGFRLALREALGSDDVQAIVLDIDSPGGLVDLVPETAAEVRVAREQKPIVAVANTMAASAAYWIAAQADELVVTHSGDVGSIGVFTSHEDWSGYDEQLGVKTTLISAGRFKVEGNPYEPLSESAQAAIQQTIDDLYSLFVDDVAAGRGTTSTNVRNGYGEGRLVPSARAVTAGLADSVATLEATVARVSRGPAPGGRRASAQDDPNDAPASSVDVAARMAELDALQPPIPTL